jgi:hypothetical protein
MENNSAIVADTDSWQAFNDPPDAHPIRPCSPASHFLRASRFQPLLFYLRHLLLSRRSQHGVVRRAPPRLSGEASHQHA